MGGTAFVGRISWRKPMIGELQLIHRVPKVNSWLTNGVLKMNSELWESSFSPKLLQLNEQNMEEREVVQ